jgi:hypothetical protein
MDVGHRVQALRNCEIDTGELDAVRDLVATERVVLNQRKTVRGTSSERIPRISKLPLEFVTVIGMLLMGMIEGDRE